MERNDRHTEYNPEQEMTRTGDEKPIGAVGQRERRPKSRAARAAQDVITGDFMGDSRLRRWYPLALYCILLVFLYIGHVFNFQRLQRLGYSNAWSSTTNARGRWSSPPCG